MKLSDKVALVTGGSEGIGYGIAEALAAEGCKVTITGRREDVLAQAAEKLGADYIAGDVSNEADAVRTVAGGASKPTVLVPHSCPDSGCRRRGTSRTCGVKTTSTPVCVPTWSWRRHSS